MKINVILLFSVIALLLFHVTKGGGHFGRDKTLHKVCSHYYWHSITGDVKEVSSCDKCQRSNPKLKKESGVLHPIKIHPQL